MSTIEPPPRPAVKANGCDAPRWTRVVPSIQGTELVVWRSVAASLLGLSIAGMVLGSPGAAMWALMLAIPALVIAEGQASWWVTARRRKAAA